MSTETIKKTDNEKKDIRIKQLEEALEGEIFYAISLEDENEKLEVELNLLAIKFARLKKQKLSLQAKLKKIQGPASVTKLDKQNK